MFFKELHMIKLSEIIKVPIEIGDTVLGGKFKNKRIVVKSIGKNDKGDITINNKPMMKFRLLTKDEGTCGYGVDGILGDIPAGPHLIKKKKKKFIQTDKGKIPLENKVTNLELMKLYRKALNQIPNSPNQKKTREKIKQLRKKLNMKEALGPSDEARRYMMLQLYGSNFVTNYKRLLNGIKNEKKGVIKKAWKDFQGIYNQIQKEMENIV